MTPSLIPKADYDRVLAAMNAFKANPPKYTPSVHCTTTAMDMIKLAGITLPSGSSPVYYKRMGVVLDSIPSGVNPYQLRKEMNLTNKVSTGIFPKP